MSDFGFLISLTKTVDTKRPGAMVGGLQSGATAWLNGVKMTPLWPVSAEVVQRLALETAENLFETFTTNVDIVAGDFLSIGGKDYPVKNVAPWEWVDGDIYKVVVVENLNP